MKITTFFSFLFLVFPFIEASARAARFLKLFCSTDKSGAYILTSP